MENIKINLCSQVSFLGALSSNSENNQNNNITNNNKSKLIIYYFSLDDQINKKLIIYELAYNDVSLIEQKKKYEIKYKEDIGISNIHLIAKANLNNKIYLIFMSNKYIYNIYSGIFDLDKNKYFPIILDDYNTNQKLKEIIKQIPDKDYITIFDQNKIYFIGGLIDQTKLRNNTIPQIPNEEESKRISSRNDYILNKSCVYFDIEKLNFEKQKYPENSLIPRYKLGGISQNGVIYLLGGFTSIPNNNEDNNNISGDLQFTKIFEDKMYQFNIANFDGEKPKEMIDNDLFVIKNKYIISFSAYKYAKLWMLDIIANKGININLKNKIKFEEFNEDNTFFRLINCEINEINNEINLIIAKIILEENKKDIKFDILNISFDMKDE